MYERERERVYIYIYIYSSITLECLEQGSVHILIIYSYKMVQVYSSAVLLIYQFHNTAAATKTHARMAK
jgi:hypothetical protein